MTQSLTTQLEAAGPFNINGDVQQARSAWVEHCRANGYTGAAKLLTDPDNNLKLTKSGFAGDVVYGLTLTPADSSGVDVCAWRTPDCTAVCVLVTAGNSTFPNVRAARASKTRFLVEQPHHFVVLLTDELRKAVARHGSISCRLNVASDLRWERIVPQLFELVGVSFYDYTKAPPSQRDDLGGRYHLTYSVSERPRSETVAVRYLERGGNASVVFDTRRGKPLPRTWHGFPVIDGDLTDARHDDRPGTVVGLRAKGSAQPMAVGGFVKAGVAS